MSGELRKGDTVQLKARVRSIGGEYVNVTVEGDSGPTFAFKREALTRIGRPQPPVGTVVVKEGVAWQRSRMSSRWYSPGNGRTLDWDDVSDGTIIFEPEDAS
jgi:hypothetical protein